MTELLDDRGKREKMGCIGERVCNESFRAKSMVEKIKMCMTFS